MLVAGGYLATDGTFVRAGPRFLFPVKAVKRGQGGKKGPGSIYFYLNPREIENTKRLIDPDPFSLAPFRSLSAREAIELFAGGRWAAIKPGAWARNA